MIKNTNSTRQRQEDLWEFEAHLVKFQTSQDDMVRPCVKIKLKKKNLKPLLKPLVTHIHSRLTLPVYHYKFVCLGLSSLSCEVGSLSLFTQWAHL